MGPGIRIIFNLIAGCIKATYAANPSTSRRAMQQTQPKIVKTQVTLNFDLSNLEIVRNASFTHELY